jgi:hypothetical protein
MAAVFETTKEILVKTTILWERSLQMNRWTILVTVGLLAILLFGPNPQLVAPSFAQQVPGIGLSELLCVLGVEGDGTYTAAQGEISVTIENDTGSSADVTITHGTSSSTHVVTYLDDDGDGMLGCGDTIIGVTK